MTTIIDPHPADDKFEQYFTEKLWDWIPQIYKVEDGSTLNPNPGVLRALIEAVGEQAAVSRRSIDRLWEDQFIEYCDDWAVPYIGALVQTRLISALNRRGRRVDVAKTIFYRRRAGTPFVLETLIRDIAGWEGVLVEAFRRMARARHGLDPRPLPRRGRLTDTQPGGWADLRRPVGVELVDGPWDELFHLFDPRKLNGIDGRYDIPKLNFHLFRQRAFEVVDSDPYNFDNSRFTFDPTGRDVHLFQPNARPGEWRPAREYEIAGPMRCRLLGDAEYRLTQAIIEGLTATDPQKEALERIADLTIRGETRLKTRLDVIFEETGVNVATLLAQILEAAITPDSGKANLYPNAVVIDLDGTDFAQWVVEGGNLGEWDTCLPQPFDTTVAAFIDPKRGRFYLRTAIVPPGDVVRVRYHYGLLGEIGAGTYDREAFVLPTTGITYSGGGAALNPNEAAVNTFIDSRSYFNTATSWDGFRDAVLQAGNDERPYLESRPSAGSSLTLNSGESTATLTIDGVWLGTNGGATPIGELRIGSDFERITIRHSTLDPGGVRADASTIPRLRLVVAANLDLLEIESSIVGEITVDGGVIEKLVLRDSIVVAPSVGTLAIDLDLGEVEMQRVTVLGGVRVNRLFASETIVAGELTVTDNQHGCFRFSAALPDSLHPPVYESHFLPIPAQFFVSQRFGDAGFAQLSDLVPETIRRGAENGSEIGAWNSLIMPIRQDGLEAKVREFQPVGRLPQYIHET